MSKTISINRKNTAQSAGFEPARAEPNGFLVHRLNHSATTATLKCQGKEQSEPYQKSGVQFPHDLNVTKEIKGIEGLICISSSLTAIAAG